MLATSSAKYLFSHAKYGDQNYDNKEDCDWLIVADGSQYQIRFRFLAFEVEDETDCGYVNLFSSGIKMSDHFC